MITGIRARNKNNLLGGINQLLGAGIRQKSLVKEGALEGALVLLLAMELCYTGTPEILPLQGFPFCWFNKNADIYSRAIQTRTKHVHFPLGVTRSGFPKIIPWAHICVQGCQTWKQELSTMEMFFLMLQM